MMSKFEIFDKTHSHNNIEIVTPFCMTQRTLDQII